MGCRQKRHQLPLLAPDYRKEGSGDKALAEDFGENQQPRMAQKLTKERQNLPICGNRRHHDALARTGTNLVNTKQFFLDHLHTLIDLPLIEFRISSGASVYFSGWRILLTSTGLLPQITL
jgi:hypothetical protein